MDGRVENHMSGGFLATAITMAVTYASGWLLDVSGRLGDAWTNVTPGQAALVIGLLTYLTHHGKSPAANLAARVCAWAWGGGRGWWRRAAGGRDMRLLGWLTAATLVSFLLLVLFARAAFGASNAGSSVVPRWNEFCESVGRQNEQLRALNDSLHAHHPDRVVDARRLELYTQAIIESERQTALLKAMRRTEFGHARSPEAGTPRPEQSAVALALPP